MIRVSWDEQMKIVAERNEWRFLKSEKEFVKYIRWCGWTEAETETMLNFLRKRNKKERG